MDNYRERRVYRRFPTRIDTTYQAGSKDSAPQTARTRNMSLGGVRIQLAERLTPGERLSFAFQFLPEGVIFLHGIVVWSADLPDNDGRYESGVRWTPEDPVSQKRLATFISAQAHTYSENLMSGDRPSSEQFYTQPIWEKFVRSQILILVLLGIGVAITAYSLWLRRAEISSAVYDIRTAAVRSQQRADSGLDIELH